MDLFKGALSLESAQFLDTDFAEELLNELQRLRDIGDFGQAAMKKCKVSAITKLYTDIDLQFVISDQIQNNAYFILPHMDKNHPFFKQMGLSPDWASSSTTLQSIREAASKSKDAGVDLRTGRVKGYFKQVKVTIVMSHNFFVDKKWKTQEIAGIFAHELGHAFTYFEYFGNIVRRSLLIDQASKTVMDARYNSEEKKKLITEVEKQLGIETLTAEKTINLNGIKGKHSIEEVLITDDVFNHSRTESSTPFYDARNVEQLADQFCVIHGMGKWQSEALAKLYKHYRDPEAVTSLEFFVVEIIKLTLFLVLTFYNPFFTLIYGLTFVPMSQIYDKPKDRILFLKRQMISNLKSTNDKFIKAKLVTDIQAIDDLLTEFTKRSTIFDFYCNYLNPVGRRMFKEETFRKGIENALNNDIFLKAAELEMIK